jgi:hypothetical protein
MSAMTQNSDPMMVQARALGFYLLEEEAQRKLQQRVEHLILGLVLSVSVNRGVGLVFD